MIDLEIVRCANCGRVGHVADSYDELDALVETGVVFCGCTGESDVPGTVLLCADCKLRA